MRALLIAAVCSIMAFAPPIALLGLARAAGHGSAHVASPTCTYGLVFTQGCNTSILAMGQNQ